MTTGTSLAAVSPQEAVRLGATSLVLFGRLFFPRTFRQDSAPFHYEMGLHLAGQARYNAFRVFRDGAKTTFLRVYVAQRLAYDLSRTIMFVGASQPHSITSVRWLRRQIERNRGFTQAFGLEPGDKWTDEWLEIRHRATGGVATVLAVGITGQIRGFNIDDYRPDLIVGDDLCNEENTATPEQRQKTANLWFGALYNSLAPSSEAPRAKMALLQTPLNREDLLESCSKDPQWNTVTYGILDNQGESRWPSRWPTAEILAEKEASIRRGQYSLWMREKECRLVAGDQMPFDPDWIRYYEDAPEGGITLLAVDPASSESKLADDTAIIALRAIGTKLYVLEVFAERGVMPDAASAKFFEFVWKYSPIKAAIETIAYQKVLKWYIEQDMTRRRLWLPIDEVKDRRKKHDRIMQAILNPLRSGDLLIRKNAADSVKLIQQLGDFSPGVEGRDDVLDALAMAITSINPALRFQATGGDLAYHQAGPVGPRPLIAAAP